MVPTVKESIYAVPSIYKCLHSLPDSPKSYVLSVLGIKSELISPPKTTLSVSASPRVSVPPLNVVLPVTVRSPPTEVLPVTVNVPAAVTLPVNVLVPDTSKLPFKSTVVAVRSISLEEIDIWPVVLYVLAVLSQIIGPKSCFVVLS